MQNYPINSVFCMREKIKNISIKETRKEILLIFTLFRVFKLKLVVVEFPNIFSLWK